MSNITFCWELGAGYGHIAGFQGFGEALVKRGHKLNALLKNTENASLFLDENEISIAQAPYWRAKKRDRKPTISYAHIISRLSYDSVENLLPLVQQWCEHFKSHATELIIADHSPTALLAARCLGIPATDYGIGFFSPPKVYPLPMLTPWVDIKKGELEAIEANVLHVINQVLKHYERTPLNYLYELFEIEENFLCTFAEMDCYNGRQADAYWGSRFSIESGVDIAWPDNDKKNIFVYTKSSYSQIDFLLTALTKFDANIVIHCASLTKVQMEKYSCEHLHFSEQPIRMKSLEGNTDLVLNHSGHGTIAACLLMGLPQLLIPTQLEQLLSSNKLAAMQFVAMIPIQKQAPNFSIAIENALHNQTLHEQAKRFALFYHGFSQTDQIDELVWCCEDILQATKKEQ